MARRLSRARFEALMERFAIKRYTVPEWGPHQAEYIIVKARAEQREALFDSLTPALRATINAVGDNDLARDLARKRITDHRQAELVKAMIGLQREEAKLGIF